MERGRSATAALHGTPAAHSSCHRRARRPTPVRPTRRREKSNAASPAANSAPIPRRAASVPPVDARACGRSAPGAEQYQPDIRPLDPGRSPHRDSNATSPKRGSPAGDARCATTAYDVRRTRRTPACAHAALNRRTLGSPVLPPPPTASRHRTPIDRAERPTSGPPGGRAKTRRHAMAQSRPRRMSCHSFTTELPRLDATTERTEKRERPVPNGTGLSAQQGERPSRQLAGLMTT